MTLIWENLPRALDDTQTISEAIGEAIADHNADNTAHLGEDESLQSHRAAEIINHLAESVGNDKLATNSRRYVAIVDPAFLQIFAGSTYNAVTTVYGGDVVNVARDGTNGATGTFTTADSKTVTVTKGIITSIV